jgi:hypothetical protein
VSSGRSCFPLRGNAAVLVVLPLALALLVTGCVYFRLMALKNQLADFDRYVRVDDRHGLVLEFIKPVLRADDIRDLFEVSPSLTTTNRDQQTWFWTFAKRPATTNVEPGSFDLTFATGFTNRQLHQFIIPERFLTAVPKPVILGIARSLGHATVDRARRTAEVRWQDGGSTEEIKAPAKDQLTQLLGRPFSVTESNLTYTWLYKYSLKSPSPAPPRYKEAWASFTFNRDTDKLAKTETVFAGIRISFSFEPPKAAPRR